MNEVTPPPLRKRGFALLDREKMREVAALGGRTAHKEGRAHQFSSSEAREAGLRSVEVRRQRASGAIRATVLEQQATSETP